MDYNIGVLWLNTATLTQDCVVLPFAVTGCISVGLLHSHFRAGLNSLLPEPTQKKQTTAC